MSPVNETDRQLRPERAAGDPPCLKVLLSVPYTTPWRPEELELDGTTFRHITRRSDWQATSLRRARDAVSHAWGVFRASRDADVVVVCTAMVDALAVAALMRLRRGTALALWDFLLPTGRITRLFARFLLTRVDQWLVIRRGDTSTFKELLGAKGCSFAPYPCTPLASADDGVRLEPIVYSAGTAHRDWTTLLKAADSIRGSLLICTDEGLAIPDTLVGRVRRIPLVDPAEGRKLMQQARIVCMPFKLTDLPCGPVVLLDAMTLGKPVVATDVNGSRDYIRDGVTGLLVPPGDSAALAAAINRLLDAPDLGRLIGMAARQTCLSEFDTKSALRAIAAGVRAIGRVRSASVPQREPDLHDRRGEG